MTKRKQNPNYRKCESYYRLYLFFASRGNFQKAANCYDRSIFFLDKLKEDCKK